MNVSASLLTSSADGIEKLHSGPFSSRSGGLQCSRDRLDPAQHHARDAGFAEVLTCAVDSGGLGDDLIVRLGAAPAYCADQPVIGLWPVSASAAVDAILKGQGRHSMRAFAESISARAVHFDIKPANINTPADLNAAEEQSHGL